VHDARLLRERPEALRAALERRGATSALASLAQLESLDADWRRLIASVEELKAQRNQLTANYTALVKQRGDAEMLARTAKELARIAEESGTLGARIVDIDARASEAKRARDDLLLQIPNITLADVPAGGEEANTVIREWGTPRPSDGLKPHWDIGTKLGLIDFEAGAKVTGSGFIVFRGLGARLVRSLINWMITLQTSEHGYDETWVPYVVNRASMTGTGQLPKFEDDLYRIESDDLFLIPTAEVPITNLFRDEILDGAKLPMGLVGYTPCFRREAGAAGKDTRGLLRVHEFDKVELVRICAPEDSPAQHELLTTHAERVLQRLGLPYRVVLLAAGDTGFASAKTYDLEVWAPGVGKWLEVSSCSTFTDFQARRANIRYRAAGGKKPEFVHTLNGSGLGFPRTIATLLEHYQQPDGSVVVPEVLRPYLGADRIG
jgi:seryl-tRNA synthetase